MSSIININGRLHTIEHIDAEGRVLARVKGSSSRYECPLKLYSDSTGIPTHFESDKILHNDSNAKWTDSGDHLVCSGCGQKFPVQRTPPQELLRRWTIHKLMCNAMQLKLRELSIKVEESEAEVRQSVLRESKENVEKVARTSVARSDDSIDDCDKIDSTRSKSFTTEERINFLLELRDITYVNITNQTVLCTPCNSEILVGHGFYVNNDITHSQSHVHRANGGIRLERKIRSWDRCHPKTSSKCVKSKVLRTLAPFPLSTSIKRKKRRPSHRRCSFSESASSESDDEVAEQRIASTASRSGRASSKKMASARDSGKWRAEGAVEGRLELDAQAAQASGHRKVTAVFHLPPDTPRSARLELNGTITF
ncbi:hypothetical protein SCHPADRAFT_943552 [Schizopora paradoxa]|uniref:Uncharacterized protein n=1 Tax=Schizopora paradoxa TaxID=27342 RepID=A0A0H2RCP1_9AGAM|nr:hypothetical protein SCHPADRAFT_943552 [Schizopora paradoxa]